MSRLFLNIYDYINSCDIGQLDAIIVASFVFLLGIGFLGGIFVLSMFQPSGIQQLPAVTESPVRSGVYTYQLDNRRNQATYLRFGRPRDIGEANPWFQPSGQASAATSATPY